MVQRTPKGAPAGRGILRNGSVCGMSLKTGLVAMHVLEVMFFVGLAGCTLTVILSWISVMYGSFKDKE